MAEIKVDPARAGMILSAVFPDQLHEGGPRASGDDPIQPYKQEDQPEWTPRERG